MTLRIADRVLETTASTGTTSFTLAGAMVGFRTFGSVCSNGDTVNYAAWSVDGNGAPTGAWEVGLGTWGTGDVLTRTTVYASSTGSAINFTAGTKRVSMTISARSMPWADGTYEMPPPSTAAANVTALSAALASGKAIIQFRAGEYEFNAAVTASIVGRTIRGEGMANTTLKLSNSHTIDYLFASSAGATGAAFEDLTFDGNRQNSSNIYCGMLKADHTTVTSGFVVRDCRLKNIRLFALRLYPNSYDISFERNRFESVEDTLFEINPWTRGKFIDNLFLDYTITPTYAGDTGSPILFYDSSDDWVIEGNTFLPGSTTTGQFAIEAQSNGGNGCKGHVIANNLLDCRNALNGNGQGTGMSGWWTESSFTGNVWRRGPSSSETAGLEVVGRSNSIVGNTCHNGSFSINGSISTSDTLGTVVANNTFIQNRTSAYPVSRQSDCITLTDANGVLVDGNSFYYEQSHISGGAGVNMTGDTADANVVRNNRFFSYANTILIGGVKISVTTAAQQNIVEGNFFEKMYRGVNIDTALVSTTHVKRNYFRGCDTTIFDSGTGTVSSDNVTL